MIRTTVFHSIVCCAAILSCSCNSKEQKDKIQESIDAAHAAHIKDCPSCSRPSLTTDTYVDAEIWISDTNSLTTFRGVVTPSGAIMYHQKDRSIKIYGDTVKTIFDILKEFYRLHNKLSNPDVIDIFKPKNGGHDSVILIDGTVKHVEWRTD